MKTDPRDLSLPLPESDTEQDDLRAMHARSGIAREYSFQQAMATPAIAICLRNLVHATRTARASAKPATNRRS